MDKAIKVGGRNLIVTSRWKAGYLYGDRDENAYPVGSENYKVLVGYDKFRFDPVYIPTLGERKVTYKLYDNGGVTSGNVQIHAYDKDKKFLWWSYDSWNGTVGRTVTWTLPSDTAYIRLGVENENVRAKVEFGTVATDWTPAPEDLDNNIYKLTSQLDIHDKTLGSQAEALEIMAGSVEMLSEQYSIEAHTIGSPILKSDTDQYDIQCRIIHTPTGTDYTDQLLLSARLITPEWYRINPEKHDRTGYTDIEWRDKHRGDAEVVITRKDFITSCTVGYKIPRDQIIKAIKSLTH